MQVLYFSADWCKPCKAFFPVVDKICRDIGIPLVHYDAERDTEIFNQHEVKSVPTLIVLKDNFQELRFSNAMPGDVLMKALEGLKRNG